ncbi:MAG: hypothetical protein JWM98_2097 [Thermoleophilia bacterium]|nr:hypothetical protein [Thermoleophilia bacterium]
MLNVTELKGAFTAVAHMADSTSAMASHRDAAQAALAELLTFVHGQGTMATPVGTAAHTNFRAVEGDISSALTSIRDASRWNEMSVSVQDRMAHAIGHLNVIAAGAR